MSKRGATSDLNHDNWDVEQEREESGEFSKASEEVLRARIVKKAKRRNPIGTYQNDDGKPNAFGGFTAFNTKKVTESTQPFGFLSNLNAEKNETPKTNGMTEKPNDDTNLEEYYAKLKGLNQGVAQWISKHVNDNPLIDLQPVFKDYENYMRDLDKLKSDISKKKENKDDTAAPVPKPLFNFAPSVTSAQPSTSSAPTFSFGSAQNAPPKFSFGPTTKSPSAAPTFSFGSSSASTVTASSGFSFAESTAKFSFDASAKAPESQPAQEDEAAEDEPPKVEFTPVVEKDHVYTIRCKVFVKKDNAFSDRGVGNLFLKPVPGKEKFQLIVRADTNLGNLLCNFILSDGIPMQRMGKKDVMLVCLPTPDSKPPPTPILLRVKTSEDADELLTTLEKHKK